jgi:large subunit ribosomal protein L25
MELIVNNRTVIGKKVNRIRKEGLVPGIVYGRHLKSPLAVQFDKIAFIKTYRATGVSTPVDLTGDQKELVLIHHVETDPVTDVVIHVDFLAVRADEKVRASVAISVTGIAPVEKDGIGKVQLVKDHVTVEALPRDLPHDIKLDLSNMFTLQDGIFVSDLQLGDKVTIIDDQDQPVVAVVQLQQEEAEVTGPTDAA